MFLQYLIIKLRAAVDSRMRGRMMPCSSYQTATSWDHAICSDGKNLMCTYEIYCYNQLSYRTTRRHFREVINKDGVVCQAIIFACLCRHYVTQLLIKYKVDTIEKYLLLFSSMIVTIIY